MVELPTRTEGQTQIVVANMDRIDASVAIRFKDCMRDVTDGGGQRCILDLSKVQFVDSSGLGAIVASMKQLEQGRRLDLAGLTPMVDKVFRLTRMDSVFAIFDSVEAALDTPG